MADTATGRKRDKAEGQHEGASAGSIDIGKAREKLGDLVVRAGYGKERIPIARYGTVVAYLIGQDDFERLSALDEGKKKK